MPDLYQNFRIWGCGMVEKKNSISVVERNCRSAILFKVGRKVDISTEISIDSAEMSKEN